MRIIEEEKFEKEEQINKLEQFNIEKQIKKEEEIKRKENFEKIKNEELFFNKYKNIIEYLKILYDNELKVEEIIKIMKNIICRPYLTIFEVMNLIEREFQIIITIHKINSSNKRKFLDLEKMNDNNKYNLVIKKFKIFYKSENMKNHWLISDKSEERRKLGKDENGFFNYLPAFNGYKNGLNKIFAKNENEIFYH